MDVSTAIDILETYAAQSGADQIMRSEEMESATDVVQSILPYRVLTEQGGNILAHRALHLLTSADAGPPAHTMLVRLGNIVPGSFADLYSSFIENKLFLGDGVLFREANGAVRDQLLALLDESSQDASIIANVLSALAWIGDEQVQEQFSQWQHDQPSWLSHRRGSLERYMHLAGWELTPDGKRRNLCFSQCYELIPREERRDRRDVEPIRVMIPREDRCGSCGRHLFTLFDYHLRDPRFAFLNLGGEQLRIAMCPTDTSLGERVFTEVDAFGKSEWSHENGEPVEPLDDLDDWEDLPPLPYDQLVLGDARRTPVETQAAYWQKGLSQIGGYPEWVQYPDYPRCPKCQQTMVFIGQLELADIAENVEGMIYAFLCADCGIAATGYQQT